MDHISELLHGALQNRLSRRQIMERGLALGLSTPVILGILAACGGGDGKSTVVASSESTSAGATSVSTAGSGQTGSASPSTGASPSAGASGSTAAASTGKSVDKVVVLATADIRFLDPTQRPTATDADVQLNIYDTLVRMDTQTLKPVPGLALSWDMVDNTTWQFKLRTGVKFHNGEDFNADSVVAWFKLLQDVAKAGKASSGQQISGVKSVEKVDETTVNFMMSAPDPILPNRLFTYYTMITPAKPIQDDGPDALMQKGIGTGPYKFKEWVKDDHVTLEANPDYWDGAPLVKTLEFRPVTEASSRAASVLAGEADMDTALSLGSLDQFEKSSKVDVRKQLSASVMYWCQMNVTSNPYFKDLRVRQAVNYAVDKDAIIKNILKGFAVQNANIVVQQAWGYVEQPVFEFDPDKAKSLLAEAGHKDGFSTTLITTPGSPDDEIVQAIANFLGDVGIKVSIKQYDLSDYIGLYTAKKIDDMAYLGKTQFAVDADYIFAELQPDKLFGWLFPFEGDASTFYQQERQELDQTKRADLAAKIQKYYHDQAGMLFLWQMDYIFGVSKKLVWTPRVDGFVMGKEISGA